MNGRALIACVFVLGCGPNGGGGPDGATCGSITCEDGQVCRYNACVPTPTPCTTDAECTGDFYCDESAGECLPWGVGPGGFNNGECVRDPVPGVFFPGAQCEWLGPPAGDPYPDHKNVLATPMVATLGGAGALAAPSIVFPSYNYTDRGLESCAGSMPANYYGVLRIIDGRTC